MIFLYLDSCGSFHIESVLAYGQLNTKDIIIVTRMSLQRHFATFSWILGLLTLREVSSPVVRILQHRETQMTMKPTLPTSTFQPQSELIGNEPSSPSQSLNKYSPFCFLTCECQGQASSLTVPHSQFSEDYKDIQLIIVPWVGKSLGEEK